MSEAQNILLLAGEAFVMSAIILALGWEATHLFRDRASLRHLAWVGAFVALLLLPVLALIVPSQIHFTVPADPVAAVSSTVTPVASAMQDTDAAAAAALVLVAPPAAARAVAFHLKIETIAFGLLSLYLAGVCAIGLRGLAAVFGLHALKRGSRVYRFDDLPKGRHQIRLSKTPNGYGPITWGLFRPIVLLPFNANFWPQERLHAVLLHETAHIERHDSLSQLLSLLVCALYWPNPLVWMAARALRNEAELAADDQVIASGMRPSSYAGELLQLASEFRSRQPALAGMPLFMAAPSALEARVKSVLAPTPLRAGVTRMEVLKIGSVAILATAALTFARPSFAQDAPAPQVETAPLPAVQAPPASPAEPATMAAPAQPAALAAPAAPSLPVEAMTPPAPIEPVHPIIKVRESNHILHGHHIHHIWMDVDTRGATAEEMERMRPQIERAEAQVRDAQPQIEDAEAQIRAAQPDIERAQAEIRANEATINALRAEEPRLRAQIEAAIARIQPEIDRAVAEARLNRVNLKIHEKMDRDLKRIELRIEMKNRSKTGPSDGPADGTDDEAPDAN